MRRLNCRALRYIFALFFSSACLIYISICIITYVSPIFPLLNIDYSLHAIPHRIDQVLPIANGKQKALVPKIIHRTYIDTNIPAQWSVAQKSCIGLHDGWEFKLWTDASSLEFITAEYPWFLDTFKSYTYPIQRADAIRYFALFHYGGIYIDLDDGCETTLTPLLRYPALLRSMAPFGISNNMMTSRPHHPFYLAVINSLQKYNKFHLSPYVRVLATTGRVFLSVVWEKHATELNQGRNRTTADGEYWEEIGLDDVLVMRKNEYERFFHSSQEGSWHSRDVKAALTILNHWTLLSILFLTVMVCSVLHVCYLRFGPGLYLCYLWMREELKMEQEEEDEEGEDVEDSDDELLSYRLDRLRKESDKYKAVEPV